MVSHGLVSTAPVLTSSPGVAHHIVASPALATAAVAHPVVASTPVVAATPVVVAPKTDCSVQNSVIQAQVCTPAFQTSCSKEQIPIKVASQKEQCEPITKTICTESTETIEQVLCVYEYQTKQEQGVATKPEVTFTRE